MTANEGNSPQHETGGYTIPRSRVLNWLLVLALLYTLYFAKTLLMPVLVAFMVALLLSPLVKLFKRYYVPRSVSAILLLAALGGPFTLLGIELAEPAEKWASRLPELAGEMTEGLESLNESVIPKPKPAPVPIPAPEKKKSFFSFFGNDDKVEVPVPAPPTPAEESPLSQRLTQGGLEILLSVLSATPVVITELLTFLIVSLFLMIFGPHLFRHATEVLPQVKNKQHAADLVEKIQLELSRYILTVSLINAGLGIAVALVLTLMKVEDALLWGALVGLLNFAPYVGPLISLCVLSVAGAAQYGMSWDALVPASVYFGINMIEAQFVTPLVLGQRMKLNPLMLMLWLILWGWLWGFIGVLLAVPLLVCLKLTADELNIFRTWKALIEAPA